MAKDERLVRFGQRLRFLRKCEKGMSREQLADLAGLSERAIIKWELGEREPGWFNVLALAHALNVGVEAFAVERMDKELPPDGTIVTAWTVASIEHNRPARKVRGKLTKRYVATLDYWQCDVDGVGVDHTTVRPVDADCTAFANSPRDEPSPRRGGPRKTVEATDEGKAKRTRKRAKGKK